MGNFYSVLYFQGGMKSPSLVYYIECTTDFCDADDFLIKIERHTYHTNNFVKAVSVLIAGIYVFNLQYSAGLKCTWIFVQKFLLEIDDEIKTPKKLIRLLSQL